jgi:hypothetical protein
MAVEKSGWPYTSGPNGTCGPPARSGACGEPLPVVSAKQKKRR